MDEDIDYADFPNSFNAYRREKIVSTTYFSNIMNEALQTNNSNFSITLVKELFPSFEEILVLKNQIKKLEIDVLDAWSFPVFLQELKELEELSLNGEGLNSLTKISFPDTLKFSKLRRLTITGINITELYSAKIDIPTLRNIKINSCNLNPEGDFILLGLTQK